MNIAWSSLEALQRWLILLASLPSAIGVIALMIWNGFSGYLVALVALMLCVSIGYCVLMARQSLHYQIATLMNLIEAITHNDFSLRGKQQKKNSALNGLIDMINELASSMQQQRLTVKQQQYLVKTVINNIDVAIVAINNQGEVAFLNNTAAKLLNTTPQTIQGQSLESLPFKPLFEQPENSVIEWNFPERHGKFKIGHDSYFEDGLRQRLLFITDVSQLLREEEYRAWRNLLRVMSHEINNTLTPIASLSQVLTSLIPTEEKEEYQDIRDGLQIIHERANNLKSFVESYRKLASLPKPEKSLQDAGELIRNLLPLFEHRKIVLHDSGRAMINIDAVQIEQLMINILKNADESMADEIDGVVTLGWQIKENKFHLDVLDEGHGIGNRDNLFVPFYSTKKNGSGIGLMLSRQIVELHGGYFSLENRRDRTGCKVSITLPV
ncbi:ATP-binding protein [Pectobacteriaceae bacterium CE90]|nr:ATP-binding protein [Pectobacteriaceae bacterium CE90]